MARDSSITKPCKPPHKYGEQKTPVTEHSDPFPIISQNSQETKSAYLGIGFLLVVLQTGFYLNRSQGILRLK